MSAHEETEMVRRIIQAMLDTQQQQVRDALIAMGWTPPPIKDAPVKTEPVMCEHLRAYRVPNVPMQQNVSDLRWMVKMSCLDCGSDFWKVES